MMKFDSLLVLCAANLLLILSKSASATDTLSASDSLTDNGTTLLSKNGSFKLGFFSPGSSTNRYIGIWYANIPIQTVVWVANRNQPINDSSGFLMIDSKSSNLVLLSKSSPTPFWSSNSTNQTQNPLVQLLDSGNLVIKDGNSENYIWQSFDYPSDTLLPGMKFGWDVKTGQNWSLSAWKNWDDPSPGDLKLVFEQYNYPEPVMWNDNRRVWRSGPWNGLAISGQAPPGGANQIYQLSYVSNQNEIYYVFYPEIESMLIRQVLNQSLSNMQYYAWNENGHQWIMFWDVPNDICESYGYCGPDGFCLINETPTCQCLKGFSPVSKQNLYAGCVRNNGLNCSGDGFVEFDNLRLPDTTNSWVNSSMNLEECRVQCLRNCSCMAYANLDLRGKGSGCAIWFGNLTDMRQTPYGQKLYIRMSALDSEASNGSKSTKTIIIATVIPISFLILIVGYFIHWRTKLTVKTKYKENVDAEHDQEDLDLPLIDLNEIVKATDNFSSANKLGEGGFGPVYKGTLEDGQEIAVKRLSRSSGQGLHEFKNEVILIAKLQHRNLVKLLSCCIQGDEKLLIYEFMPNKSLDYFIFDQERSKQLDWSMRHKIICGIARGLLYLHQDSRLRIIHRDLKASNILLDNQMNPKISDFGMAKTFGGEQTEGNTKRVVGTYGYMAPEYAADGLFSVKSDVFSFGVLMMEIISGKRSRGFYHSNQSHNLVAYAWRLWKDGKYLELVDSALGESCHLSQVMRCVHISLLCVQQNAEERPVMEYVVLMLSSEIKLPEPNEPGYYRDKGPFEIESSSSRVESSSTNELTYSLPDPR